LLGQPEYEVQTEINPSIFNDFIKFLQSETVEITAANFSGISSLCSEFGFNELFPILTNFQKFHSEFSDRLSHFDSGQRFCQFEELNFQLSDEFRFFWIKSSAFRRNYGRNPENTKS
jgi:hypothetical protein